MLLAVVAAAAVAVAVALAAAVAIAIAVAVAVAVAAAYYFVARTFNTVSEGFAKSPVRKATCKHRVARYAFLAEKT